MPACLRALICMLLLAAPAWAAAPSETDIIAEFVGCDYGQGFYDCTFISHDNTAYSITFCDEEDMDVCMEWRTANSSDSYRDIDERKNLGRQFIITPNKVQIEYNNSGNIDYIRVQAKYIQLDKRINTPKNTKIIPYKTLSGSIQCFWDENELQLRVSLVTKKGKRYELSPQGKSELWRFSELCKIKNITLMGEFHLWRGKERENIFEIYCNDENELNICFRGGR